MSSGALLRDAATLQFGAMARAAGGVTSAFALTHLLGARHQGEYVVATALAALPWMLLGPGAQAIAVREATEGRAAGDVERGTRALAALVKLHLSIGVATALLSAALLPACARGLLGLDVRVGVWAAVLACAPVLDLPRAVATGALLAARRTRALARMEVGAEALRVVLVVAGALLTGDLSGAALGALAAPLVTAPLAWSLWRAEGGADAPPGPGAVWAELAQAPVAGMVGPAFGLGLVRNTTSLGKEILPPLIAAGLAGSEWAAFLRLGQRLLQAALLFSQGIARAALPVFSRCVGARDWRGLARAYRAASLVAVAAAGMAWALLLVLLPALLALLVPLEYEVPVRSVALALTPCLLGLALVTPAEAFHVATRTVSVAATIVLAGLPLAVLSMALGAVLLGGVGVAWGLSAATAIALVHPLFAAAWLRARMRGVDQDPASLRST